MRRAVLAVTAEAAGSGGNHPRKGDDTPEPLEQDLVQAARRSRGLAGPGIELSRAGDPQRQSDPAAEPLASLAEVVAARADGHHTQEALQEVEMALEAQMLTGRRSVRARSW
jgi:hypothetical protein